MFVYQEEGLPPQLFSSPNGHHHSLSSTSVERDDIQQARETRNYVGDSGPPAEDAASQSASASVSANTSMNRMVDALVDSETSEAAPPVSSFQVIQDSYPPAPTGHPVEMGSNSIFNYDDGASNVETSLGANYATIRASQTPTATQFPMGAPHPPRPNLPTISYTPFTPQPGEATSPQSRPGTAKQTSPPIGSPYPMSSYTALQHGLNVDKQALQSSPQNFSSSWDTPVQRSQPLQGVPNNGAHHLYHHSHIQPFPPDRTSFENRNMSNAFSSNPFSQLGSSIDNSPRPVNANLGAIGQTPPSGQGGG